MTGDPDAVRIACVSALLALMCAAASAAPTANQERADAAAWISRHIAGSSKAAPFSFGYGRNRSEQVLASWHRENKIRRIDAVRTERTVTWTQPDGLCVRLIAVEYRDVPAVDWVVRFVNTGKTDTPILDDIQALDTTIGCSPDEPVVVHHALGDSNSVDSFRPITDNVAPAGRVQLCAHGGRSSEGAMPFFNLQQRNRGIAAAIGWSGQWAADFQRDADRTIRVRAGMERTHLTLHPGEEIRSPRILLVFWRGTDDARGNRLLRRTLVEHYTPRRTGEVVFPPICGTVSETDPDGTYEGPHVRVMRPLAERGVEVFWSDMDPQQWYPGGFPTGTGTWDVDPAKYPHGLKPVGDAARAAGLGYLLWFEPERVAKNTRIANEHPEWVSGGAKGGLFRLDYPDARRWITEKIDEVITECGLLWVRWDFNIAPLDHWRRSDAADRQGMTEIRHIEGLYAMWDELERRHPGLLIDICASGGRRLDIETLSRGLPLWHSDMQCFGPKPEADQLQTAALYRWLPLHGSGLFGLEPSYVFRSEMTTGNVFCLGAHNPENADGVRKSAALQKRLRPYTLGDFYELLPHSDAPDRWFAYQFHRSDIDAGYLVAFRRAQCAGASTTLALSGIRGQERYEVVFEDTGEHRTLKGRELAALQVTAPAAPGSAIVTYQRVK